MASAKCDLSGYVGYNVVINTLQDIDTYNLTVDCEITLEVKVCGGGKLQVQDSAGNIITSRSSNGKITLSKPGDYVLVASCGDVVVDAYNVSQSVCVEGVTIDNLPPVEINTSCTDPLFVQVCNSTPQVTSSTYCNGATDTHWRRVVSYIFTDPNDQSSIQELIISDADTGVPCSDPIEDVEVITNETCNTTTGTTWVRAVQYEFIDGVRTEVIISDWTDTGIPCVSAQDVELVKLCRNGTIHVVTYEIANGVTTELSEIDTGESCVEGLNFSEPKCMCHEGGQFFGSMVRDAEGNFVRWEVYSGEPPVDLTDETSVSCCTIVSTPLYCTDGPIPASAVNGSDFTLDGNVYATWQEMFAAHVCDNTTVPPQLDVPTGSRYDFGLDVTEQTNFVWNGNNYADYAALEAALIAAGYDPTLTQTPVTQDVHFNDLATATDASGNPITGGGAATHFPDTNGVLWSSPFGIAVAGTSTARLMSPWTAFAPSGSDNAHVPAGASVGFGGGTPLAPNDGYIGVTTYTPAGGETRLLESPALAIQPNTDYLISVTAANIGFNNPEPSMTVEINGVPVLVGATFPLNNLTKQTFTWNSGAATTAQITLRSDSTSQADNDFVVSSAGIQVETNESRLDICGPDIPQFTFDGGSTNFVANGTCPQTIVDGSFHSGPCAEPITQFTYLDENSQLVTINADTAPYVCGEELSNTIGSPLVEDCNGNLAQRVTDECLLEAITSTKESPVVTDCEGTVEVQMVDQQVSLVGAERPIPVIIVDNCCGEPATPLGVITDLSLLRG